MTPGTDQSTGMTAYKTEDDDDDDDDDLKLVMLPPLIHAKCETGLTCCNK